MPVVEVIPPVDVIPPVVLTLQAASAKLKAMGVERAELEFARMDTNKGGFVLFDE